ncbi:MAG: cytochrome b/b6 domain-containing protein [Methylococcales bacterium]|nr:cytochrome b/b6 domain-containing protein [Methylococcales bacterium]
MKDTKSLIVYPVWRLSIRLFHGLNFICVMGLIFIGLIIFYNKDLGVSSDGKILLKTIHVYIGYLFAINLIIRFISFFSQDRYSNGKAIFRFGKNDLQALILFIKGRKSKEPSHYLGHNPLAKLMINILFLLLTAQAVTGLVLAGTDLYFPPFGDNIALWVTQGDPEKLAALKPGSKEYVNIEAYNEMRTFRKPFITIHKYVFYSLLISIFLHILGVTIAELKEKSGLISAMITGNKVFSSKPIDDKEEK